MYVIGTVVPVASAAEMAPATNAEPPSQWSATVKTIVLASVVVLLMATSIRGFHV